MRLEVLFTIWLLLFISIFPVFSQSPEDIEARISSLLERMNTDEKIGQLVQWNGSNPEGEQLLKSGGVGSFLNVRSLAEIHRLQKIAVEETRLGIPVIFGNDVIHGYHTTFPIPLAAAASWNPVLVEKAARIAALEAALAGTQWTFAPMVDIARDPRWGRIAEGAGEDPYLGSIMAEAQVRGFQGEDLSDPTTIAACAKHYAAYGAPFGGVDYNTVDMSERTLREIYLSPFKTAVDAGVATLMSAFNEINGIPASANPLILTQILRGEWGFDGFVVSDYNSIGELIPHGFARDKREAARKALPAGVDMDMVGNTTTGNVYSPHLKSLVESGEIPMPILDEAVRRVLRIKFRLGLFERPYADTTFLKAQMPSVTQKNETALQLARESIVLLKNENNLLPLKKDLSSIAVIGPLADNRTDPLGPWTTRPIIENVVTVLEGIRNYASPQTRIQYEKGCDMEGSDTRGFAKAVEIARAAEVVLLVMGESRDMSGEAATRAELNLPGVQEKMVKEIYDTGKPVIVVLMNGRPLTINWMAENIPAIVEGWFLGDQTGNAIADVIFGNYNPSGKLPVTFPRAVGQIPIFYNHKKTGRPFDADNKFTAKYLDVPVTPLYPFGYGMSYTRFDYRNLKVSSPRIRRTGSLQVQVEVSNSGNRAGEEVVQLYIRDEFASVTRPVKELKGFRRVHLAPGENKSVSFTLIPEEHFSFLNPELERVVEPGNFKIFVGGNSVEVLETRVEVY